MPPQRSLAFARIRAEVLAATSWVPKGRVTTYTAVGAPLGISARQVSHLLATLTDEERDLVPSAANPARRQLQAAELEADGVRTEPGPSPRDLRIEAFARRFFDASLRKAQPGPVPRYADPHTRPRFARAEAFGYPMPPQSPDSSKAPR
ncbi:MAG: hypothetical protein KA712_24515 [Myxococcales bacterium]|nr:hypothetical protein [Myxococcales bacterium]